MFLLGRSRLPSVLALLILTVPLAQAQVVIRERVAVHPDSAMGAASTTAPMANSSPESCGLPVVGYAVFKGTSGASLSTWSGGEPLAGTVEVTTTCGGGATDVGHGFALMAPPNDIWENHYRGLDRYNYTPLDSVEVLRLPLRALEDVTVWSVTAAGTTKTATGSSISGEFGCGYYGSCAMNPPRGASFGIARTTEGQATRTVALWQPEVQCGARTPLSIMAVKDDDSEGWLRPGFTYGYQLPTKTGWIDYGGTLAWTKNVSYADARTGVPLYVAPPCTEISADRDGTVWVKNGPGGLLSGPIRVLALPPDRLAVEVEPDTVSVPGSSLVTAVAKADTVETWFDPNVYLTFSVSSPELGLLSYNGGAPASSVVIRYPFAKQPGVSFVAATPAPLCDTPVTVTAAGGGLSGSADILIRGSSTGAPDTLIVSASPNPLAPGDSAAVSAVARNGDGCDVSTALPDSTAMVVAVSRAIGVLEYEGERGLTLSNVPYGALRNGDILFIALEADSTETTCGLAWIGVFGAGLKGEAPVEVQGYARTAFGRESGQRSPAGPSITEMNGAPACEDTLPDNGQSCGSSPNWEAVQLVRALEEDPAALLDVLCEHLEEWAEVGSHEAPLPVLDRLEMLEAGEPFWNSCWWKDWSIQELTEADGALVNMDYYPVRLTLPADSGWTAEAYFERVRRWLGDYLDQTIALFRPYAGEEERWLTGPVLGTVGHFDIYEPFGLNGEDLAVVVSEYSLGPDAWRWRFSTIWTPGTMGHPVSGTREFGLIPNGDGSYTFYTRGVDRLWNWIDLLFANLPGVEGEPNPQFDGADALWRSLQANVQADVLALGGAAEVVEPTLYRPDWEAVSDYFNGLITLDELLTRHGCNP